MNQPATLDTASGQQILGLLDELSDEGVTIVVITHDVTVTSRTRRPAWRSVTASSATPPPRPRQTPDHRQP